MIRSYPCGVQTPQGYFLPNFQILKGRIPAVQKLFIGKLQNFTYCNNCISERDMI